jgi:GNAT superfamily N-acetyltransferase
VAAAGYELTLLDPSDAAECYLLSSAAGWNQTKADWGFMLAEGRGVGLVTTGDGTLVATGIALPFSENVEWIAMVLVRQKLRRRGLGRRVMQELIDRSSTTGLALDATESGRPLYEQLSFVEQERIVRMRLDRLSDPAHPRPIRLAGTDLEIRERLTIDPLVYEVNETIHSLINRTGVRRFECGGSEGDTDGLACLRPGRTVWHVGPVNAGSAETAKRLISHALACCTGHVQIDVPVARGKLIAHLSEIGFTRDRDFVRMARGNSCPIPKYVFAVAGPEYG